MRGDDRDDEWEGVEVREGEGQESIPAPRYYGPKLKLGVMTPSPVGVYEGPSAGLPIGEAYGAGSGRDGLGRPATLWRIRLKGVGEEDQPRARYRLTESGEFVEWEGPVR